MSEQILTNALRHILAISQEMSGVFAARVEEIASEALAATTGEQVELTDEEIDEAACGILYAEELDMVRRVIAAHEAKRNGGAE